MTRHPLRTMLLATLLPLAVACTGPGDTATDGREVPTEPATPSPTTTSGDDATAEGGVELVAQNMAFSPAELSASPGDDVTIRFENRDPVQHAFALFPEGDDHSPQDAIFLGEPLSGPDASTVLTFAAPEAGSYVFVCPIHPDDMVGTFTMA